MRRGNQNRRSPLSQGILSGVSAAEPQDIRTVPAKVDSVDLSKSLTELSISYNENKAPIAADMGISYQNEPESLEGELEEQMVQSSHGAREKLRMSGAEVLVNDASGDHTNYCGEVDTKSFKMPSPARIVRHSLSPTSEGTVPDRLVTNKNTCASVEVPSFDEGTSTDRVDIKNRPRNKKAASSAENTLPHSKGGNPADKNTKGKPKKSADISMRKKNTFAVPSRYMEPKDDTKFKSLYLSEICADDSTVDRKGRKGITHSTPYVRSNYEKNTTYDGSILDTTALQSKELVNKGIKKKTKLKEKASNISMINASVPKDEESISQLTLDLHYNRLLQVKFLMMEAKRTFAKQQEKAKHDIYGLWSLNSTLEKEVKSLEYDGNIRKIESCVDPLLNAQIEGFDQYKDKSSKIITKTSQLSDALTNTAHYLPIRNVYISNEDEILQAFDESKRLLADLYSSTKLNQPKIEGLSSAADGLVKILKSELNEERQCRENLALASSLTNQERSLQVQLIHTQSHDDKLFDEL